MRHGSTQEVDLPLVVDILDSANVVPMMEDVELKVEFKKLNKNLRQLIDLKK